MKRIAIIGGCGHVGFPLGLALSKGFIKYVTGGGYNYVELIDINTEVIESINAGKVPFQ